MQFSVSCFLNAQILLSKKNLKIKIKEVTL